MLPKKIKTALVSVYHKDGLDVVAKQLKLLNIKVFSTGGTQTFLESHGLQVFEVENLTTYPSILGGRVKTLHPKVFGGILGRRNNQQDIAEMENFEIPEIDLVIVDLYPFEETVLSGASESEIIEKIDIGGISLIRAAAKNYHDVVIVATKNDYSFLNQILSNNSTSTLEQRKQLATNAFNITSHYDTAIFNYFNSNTQNNILKLSFNNGITLRYGENPHQKGVFYGNFNELFEQINGKELSYNNLLDVDAAINLMAEFKNQPTFAILKHNNACGLASKTTLLEAWQAALAADPVSAFGGILISNTIVDFNTATEINNLFFEVIIAPNFNNEALAVLTQKKNRIILKQKTQNLPTSQIKSLLNGVIYQEKDLKTETHTDINPVTELQPTPNEIDDLLFANKIVKHTKSNTIVLAKNNQLISSGTGQTSRVDALNQAIEKAKRFNFDLTNAVMASDAFFPFPDCVEIANNNGIKAVIQPGGSVKDQDSINYCNKHQMKMVFTGTRHFKH